MINVLAAAEWGGEFDGVLDDINALFDFPFIFEFTIAGETYGINRTIIIAWIMMLVVGVVFFLGTRKADIVPGKLQAFIELIVDFNAGIAHDIIGDKGKKFVPILTTFFCAIFVLNLAKITPFMMMPPTGRIAWPLFLAGIAWLIYVGVGIQQQGFLGYFKGVAFPSGVPWPLYIILTPIEIISTLVLRPATLAIRLFANMVAGHILVVITLVTPWIFLPSPAGWPIGVFTVIAGPLVFGFELFIIGLQAYIFSMLTAVYIDSSMEAH
ncbi:MAG: F0F1 ATP synthase subunit A [Nitriliruptoraceae bacterium]|nr:F0F1 ATP synthase subunit A [Nitriliruptoraceae bacterium]